MTPVDWATRPLKKYADFTGRAPRAEYWWFYLGMVVAYLVAMIIDSLVSIEMFGPYGVVTCLLALALIVPGLAVTFRRLHDTNRSGWWILCPIANIIFLFIDGTPGPNRFGPDPKGRGGEQAFA